MCFLVHAQTGRNKISETFLSSVYKDVTVSRELISHKNFDADRNKAGH